MNDICLLKNRIRGGVCRTSPSHLSEINYPFNVLYVDEVHCQLPLLNVSNPNVTKLQS